ncbi:LVIVD repeat-containing protein [Marinicella litoralis]|uniref:LVIVD repeat-containing protein n=1 Tax=Marinicella litoralis TaxID=644220 RepID=A0A4R6XPZ4_9GAMM|nr:hypothetical protein [Marinicella litoralis]TDR20479.1 hypothetical protein C8D91_1453 [Marinicella litoralis]
MRTMTGVILLILCHWAAAQLADFDYAGHWPYGPANTLISHQANGNNYLFFAEGGVLHVAIVNANHQPAIHSSFRLLSPIEHLTISPDGTKLAASDKQQWVSLLNIADPESIYLLGRFDFAASTLPAQYQGGAPYGMAFKDNNTLITTVTPKGLFALDVSDPLNIQIVGDYIELGINSVWDVEIYADHAWIADGFDGLSVVDITDINQMSLVFRDSNFSRLTGIHIAGDKAYLDKGLDGLNVIELQTSPVIAVNTLLDMDNSQTNYVRGVRPMGTDHLVVAELNDGLKVFDIQDPNNPMLLYETTTGAFRFTLDDQVAHVITPSAFTVNHDLESHDLSTALTEGSASLVQALPLLQNSIHIFSDDRYVLAATDNSGLALLSLGNPSRPNLMAWLYPESSFTSGVILGDLVLGTTSNQLMITDISNPAQPVELPPYDLLGYSSNHEILVVDDNEVIVGGDVSSQGLKWLEISQDGSINLLAQWSEGAARQVAKSGDLLAIAGALSFYLVDFSDKANPQTLFTHTLNRPVFGIDWVDNYLYIANNTDGLRIWDTSIPSMAHEVADIDFIFTMEGVKVHNNVAYLAAGALYGLMMYDVTDPTQPVYLSGLNTPGLAKKVTVSDQVLAIADNEAGVIIFSNTLSFDLIFANDFEAAQ